MFYCIVCKKLHKKDASDEVFTTGFYTLPNGEKVPLGVCSTKIMEKTPQEPDRNT